jgi:hypothetical protein
LDEVISDERCRKIIIEEAARAKSEMTATELLQYAQMVVPGRLPLSLMARISSVMGEKLDWGKEKHGLRVYYYPYPIVILAVLTYLFRHSMTLEKIMEEDKRCLIVATIPSTKMNLKGRLEIIVVDDESKTRVLTSAKLFGQWLDWGKAEGAVDDILAELEKLSARFSRDKRLKKAGPVFQEQKTTHKQPPVPVD